MKALNLILTVTIAASLLTSPTHVTAASSEARGLLEKILTTKANVADIQSEQKGAIAAENARLRAMSDCIVLLSFPETTEERIKDMQSELNRAKARIISLEQQIEVAKISDPAARKTKQGELKQAQNELEEHIKTLEAPYQKRIVEALKPIEEIRDAWAEALDAYFLAPSDGPFAGLTKSKVSWSSNETGQISWSDSNGKRVCWLSIFLQTSPEKTNSNKTTLYDKYPTNFMKVTNMWVSCGNLKFAMNVKKPEWSSNEAAVTELFKALVDINGINNFSPQPAP